MLDILTNLISYVRKIKYLVSGWYFSISIKVKILIKITSENFGLLTFIGYSIKKFTPDNTIFKSIFFYACMKLVHSV